MEGDIIDAIQIFGRIENDQSQLAALAGRCRVKDGWARPKYIFSEVSTSCIVTHGSSPEESVKNTCTR